MKEKFLLVFTTIFKQVFCVRLKYDVVEEKSPALFFPSQPCVFLLYVEGYFVQEWASHSAECLCAILFLLPHPAACRQSQYTYVKVCWGCARSTSQMIGPQDTTLLLTTLSVRLFYDSLYNDIPSAWVLEHVCFDWLSIYLVLIRVSCFVVLFSVLFRLQLKLKLGVSGRLRHTVFEYSLRIFESSSLRIQSWSGDWS